MLSYNDRIQNAVTETIKTNVNYFKCSLL